MTGFVVQGHILEFDPIFLNPILDLWQRFNPSKALPKRFPSECFSGYYQIHKHVSLNPSVSTSLASNYANLPLIDSLMSMFNLNQFLVNINTVWRLLPVTAHSIHPNAWSFVSTQSSFGRIKESIIYWGFTIISYYCKIMHKIN